MKILFVIDRSSAFREIVRSKVLEEMTQRPGVEVVLASTKRYQIKDSDLPEGVTVKRYVVDLEPGNSLTARFSYFLDKIFHTVSRDVACVLHPDSTLAQIRHSMLRARGKNIRNKLAYASFLASLGLRPIHFANLAERWGPYPEFTAFLKRQNPDLIVYSNMMMGQMDCLRAARRLGIPLLLDLPSWDQPTSKGPITVQPDFVVAWSQEMKEDLIRLHDIPTRSIHVGGVLYFDHYFDPPTIVSRDEYCRKMGIPPEHKIVLYSLSRIKSAPAAGGFIEKLYSMLRDSRLGFPVTLIVRANPLDDVNALKQEITRPDLLIQFPTGDFDANGSDWKAGPTEATDRIAAITYADVMVMIQSTMVLDAACLDRPIINLAYDNNLQLDEMQSVKRIFHFNHGQLYQKLGSTWMVRNEEELGKALVTYLQDPKLHSPNRLKLIAEIDPSRDGLTYKRWVDYVIKCTEESISSRPLRSGL